MPKDKDKYANPQKVLVEFEFRVAINRKLKRKDLTKKEGKILIKELFRSYDQTEKEFSKPLPPLNSSYRERNKFLFEPYRSYFEELMWDKRYYQKPIKDPVIKALRRVLYGSPLHQKFNDIMSLIRIYTKKFQMVKKLRQLQFTNKQEAEERNMALDLQIIDSYLISKYTSQRIKGFDVSIKRGKVTVKRPDLNALEAQMYIYALMKSTLERTVFISAALQDKSLSEDKRNEYIKKREKFRKNFDFAMTYEIRRALQNDEDYEKFREEHRGAHKDAMKFLALYLESSKELLKTSPYVETDITMEELDELSKLLKRSDLNIEERKYFLQRKDLIEKDIDWEGKMKKLVEDFPYEKDRYFPKMDQYSRLRSQDPLIFKAYEGPTQPSSVRDSMEKEDDTTQDFAITESHSLNLSIEMDKREKRAIETVFRRFKGSKLGKSQTEPLSANEMHDIVILTSKYKFQTVLALFFGFFFIFIFWFLAFFLFPGIDDERVYGFGLQGSGVGIVLILLIVLVIGVGGRLIIFALNLRHFFIVLHYQGIYYKKIGKPKFISWADIDRIVGYLRTVRGSPTERAVKIHLRSSNKVRFNSSNYLFKDKFFDFDDVFYSYQFRRCPFYSMDKKSFGANPLGSFRI